MKLEDLQSSFAKHLIGRMAPSETDGFASALVGKEDERNARFNVYIESVHLSLGNALKVNFPAVTSLVGDDFMSQLCHDFTLLYPPSRGGLNRYGENDFPNFIATVRALDALPYLPDVGRLDAAINRAFYSKKLCGLSADDLATRFSDPEAAYLSLNAPVSILSSQYPILSLRNYCLGDDHQEDFSMDRDAEIVLVTRDEHEVVIEKISVAQFDFLNACKASLSVPHAIDLMTRNHPDFDLQEMFVQFVKAEIFV